MGDGKDGTYKFLIEVEEGNSGFLRDVLWRVRQIQFSIGYRMYRGQKIEEDERADICGCATGFCGECVTVFDVEDDGLEWLKALQELRCVR
jgi:hypothetical protein